MPDVHAAGAAAPNAASALPREKSSSPPKIVHIAAIPPWTSVHFHFVAVTADGRRVFFEANPVRSCLCGFLREVFMPLSFHIRVIIPNGKTRPDPARKQRRVP